MSNATITVVEKAPPGLGKKQGKLKDSDGNVWNIWGDKMLTVTDGGTYDITFEEQEFNGKTYNLIKTLLPVVNAPKVAPKTNIASQPTSFTTKDEMIFVCGALNYTMSNQCVNPMELQATEVITFVNLLRSVWRATLGRPASQAGEAMDDEIPF